MKIYSKLKSKKDKKILIKQLKNTNLEYFFDQEFFCNKVFKKPWGYEFLLFSNTNLSIIILCLNPYSSTSFHCHPKKTTSITLIEGSIKIKLSSNSLKLNKNDTLEIGKGIFHKTSNIVNKKTVLMEIETPTLKEDLLRVNDNYGRKISGYDLNYSKMTKRNFSNLGIRKTNSNSFLINKMSIDYFNFNKLNDFKELKNKYKFNKSIIFPIFDNKKNKIDKLVYSLSKLSDNKIQSFIKKTNFFLVFGEKK